MKLMYAPQSPFARKVRASAIELGLEKSIELVYVKVVPGLPSDRKRDGRSGPTITSKIFDVLTWFDANPRTLDPSKLNIAHCALMPGIGYIDFRFGDAIDWRKQRPSLSSWVDAVSTRPCFGKNGSDGSIVMTRLGKAQTILAVAIG